MVVNERRAPDSTAVHPDDVTSVQQTPIPEIISQNRDTSKELLGNNKSSTYRGYRALTLTTLT